MKLLHEQSSQCLRSELDLFSLPPTQTAVDGSQWVEHSPVSTITSSSPIEFIVSGSGEDYMDLNNTLLEVKACIKKPTFDMIGPLHVDVFNQSKYMLNGVTMKVRMTRSKDSFVLMAKSDVTESFKVDILSAKLFVRKLKITPSLCLAHERILQQKTAKYPITRVECKVIHLPQGQKSFTHDNLFLGQLPKRIVLGLVDNRAFNGDISLNPYNFQHCNLNYLAVHLDGQQVPWAPLQPSFSGSSYIRAFYTQFTGGDGISSDTGNTFGREQFVNGHALYCFDLTPDLSSSCGHHFSVTKSGNLRLELAFEVALSITGNVLVYSEFDNVIEMDKDRKVTRNYGH